MSRNFMLSVQLNDHGCLSEDRFILMKTKHSVHTMVSAMISGIMTPFIIPHHITLHTEAFIKNLEEVVLLRIRWVITGRPYIWQQDLAPCHTSRSQCWLLENSVTTSFLTSGHLTPRIPIPLLFEGCIWVRDQQNSLQHQRWTKGKDKNNIYQLKQGLQEIPKSSGSCRWSQWWFLWINFIHSISRYFDIILVNISEVRCLRYFHFSHNLDDSLTIALYK